MFLLAVDNHSTTCETVTFRKLRR